MEIERRLEELKSCYSLNVTFTTPKGKGIRKVSYDPSTARSLIEVPYNEGFVFNRNHSFEGLDNFLRLRGYNQRQIKQIHQEIQSPRLSEYNKLYQRYREISSQILREYIQLAEIEKTLSLTPSQESTLTQILNQIENLIEDPFPSSSSLQRVKKIKGESLPQELELKIITLLHLISEKIELLIKEPSTIMIKLKFDLLKDSEYQNLIKKKMALINII